MKKYSLVLGAILILFLIPSISMGEVSGEMGISVGAIFPQGDFARYSDPGPSFLIRANPHIPGAEAFSGWFSLGINAFSSQQSDVDIEVENFIIPGKKNIDEYGGSLHIGLQLGSASRHGFFRPRAAIAPGVYYFNTETSIRAVDNDEDLVEINNSQFRIGWKAIIGADFFFTPKWGVSAKLVYDQVINLHRQVDIDEDGNAQKISRSARFNGFMVGVVIPFDTMDE